LDELKTINQQLLWEQAKENKNQMDLELE
jgi:hypothetical protein